MTVVRVPLVNPVTAIVYRLDIPATWAIDPPGAAYSQGFDPITRQPIVSRTAGVRSVPRAEMAPIEIPAQVEVAKFEELQSVFGGDNPATSMVFVFHREDLEALSLLDVNRDCLLKPGDRIGSIKNSAGATAKTFVKPLYILELRPRSWGFGPDGYDLEIAYTTNRSADPNAR